MNRTELQNRFRSFALHLVPLYKALPKKKIPLIVYGQLLRTGFSAAANYKSACNGQTKKLFIAKLGISLEEMDETVFGWK